MHTFVFSYLLKRLVITTVSRDCKSNGHDSLMQYLYTVASKGFSMLSLLFFGFFLSESCVETGLLRRYYMNKLFFVAASYLTL